jgi:hypothetical protein
MATQNVNIGVNVSDNGTAKKVVQSFKEITNAAAEAQRAAGGISATPVKSTMVPGGTPGSRRASQPSGSQQMSGEQYGSARGSAGLTGASARDFANQAQGLGGLVRVYATYAANVFAVSAAFTALRSAMDTTNMIKGLDQLGVKSGIALGSLAKRLAEATDNAISLREAMEATVKASSSGMNSDQILRMGKVAKQASLALGVDMSDAISRLTRGITKLEPELLDELAIFIRIDDVVQAYAKSVGKSASAISDFERRMAFANATLDQGEKKFSAIDIESNPYSQLSAAVRTLTQSGLELLNTFLTPAIRLLSSSPTSLGIAIAGIAAIMLKQAIPAIGQYREHLSSLAEESKNRVGRIYADQQKALAEGDAMAAERASIAFRSSSKVAREVKDLQASAASFTNTTKTKWSELAAKNPFELTEKELKALDDRATRLSKSNKNESDALRGHLADMRRLRQKDNEAQDIAQTQFEKKTSGLGSGAGQTQILANRALQAASAANIRSLVSEKQAIYGAREALKLLNLEIAKSKAGMRTVDILDAQGNVIEKKVVPATNALQNGWTRVTGAVGIATGSISKFLDVASPWIMAIGLAVQAFSILDNAISGNKKELTDFNATLERSENALDMLSKTLDDVADKPFGEQFNTASLTAAANAIGEIGASVAKLIRDLDKVEKASNGWDRFINTIKSAWGGDVQSKFAESMTDTVVGALNELAGSPEAAATRKRLSELLSLDPDFTTKEFEKAIKGVSKNTPLLKQVSDVVLSVGTSMGIAAQKSKTLDDSFANSKTALKELQNQFKVSDTMSLFGQKLVADSVALTAAFEEPRQALARLADLVKDTDTLSTFSSADRDLILSYADAITTVNSKSDEQEEKVKSLNKELEKQNEIIKDYKKETGRTDQFIETNLVQLEPQIKKAIGEQNRVRALLAKEQDQLDKTKLEVIDITSKFSQLAGNQLQRGADKISAGITAAFAKSAGVLQQAAAGILEGLPGIAEIQRDIANRQIDSETNLLTSQLELIRVTKENSATIALNTAKSELEKAQEKQVRGEAGYDRVTAEQGRLEAETAQRKINEQTAILDVIKLDPKQAQAAIDAIVKGAKAGNKEMASQAESLMGYVSSIAGIGAQLADKAAQKQANNLKARIGGLAAENKVKQDGLTRDIKGIDGSLEKLALQEKINGSLTEAQILEKQKLLDNRVDLETQKTVADLETKQKSLRIADEILAKSGLKTEEQKTNAKARGQEIEKLTGDIATANSQVQSKYNANKLQALNETSKLIEDQVAFEEKLLSIRKSGTDALKDAEEQTAKTVAEMNKSLEKFTPEYQAQQDAMLKATQIRNEAERKSQQITSDFIIKSLTLQRKAKDLEASGATSETISKVTQELDAEAAAYNNKVIAINKARDTELDALKQTEDARKKTGSFDDLLKSIVGLDSVWENFGASLASTAKAFANLSKSQDQYTNTLDVLYEKLGNTKDPEKQIEVFNEIKKTQKSQQIAEVRGYAQVAGEAKNMFKEKTAAYKTFAQLERVLHVVSVAMSIQRIYQQNAETIAAAAGSAKRVAFKVYEAGVSAVASVIEAIKGPFPMNVIAGAATAAVVAGLLSQIGGKGPSMGGGGSAPFSATSEQLQETQGTGMTFNAKGEKVATGGGILGDDEAKANSVVRSLEILQENSFESLSYDNKLLRSFQGIASAIGKATNIAVTSGLRTVPVELAATLGTSTDKNDTTGIGIVDSLLGSVFGGDYSENRTLQNRRLELRGTFDSVQNDMANGLKLVTDVLVKWKEDGGWFGRDDAGSFIQTSVDSASTDLNAAFNTVLDYFKEGYVEIATQLKQEDPLQFVTERLKAVALTDSQGQPLKLDLTGLNGADEIRAELEAYFSQINNIALKSLFPEFAAFETAGEDYGTTVIRIIQNTEQVRLGLMSVGMSLNVTGNTAYRVTDVLLEAAGGIDNFVDQLSFFSQKFLSDAERLAPVQAAVSQEMSRLGFSTTTTREQFKLLVQAQDLNTVKGQENYLALMNVAEGFDEVTSAAEEAAERLNQSGLTIQQEILSLLGDSAQVLAISRAKTLAGTPDELKALQEYVFTLQDVKTAETNLTKARETEVSRLKQQKSAVESTISSLNNYINSIKKFRESLLLGAQSTLTPSEKYAESKRQFDAILATAMGTAATPEEQRTKDQALSQLEGSASAFLDASRIYNASSSQYTNDFNTVQRALSDTESSLLSQLSIEENSLKQLETQTGLLEDQIAATNAVNNSVISVAQATADLASAIRARDMAFERTVTTGGPADGVGPINLTSTERAIQDYFNQFQNRSVDQSVLQDYSREIAGGTKTLSSIKDEIMSNVSARSTTGAVLVGDMIYGLDDKSIGATQAASNIRNYIANIAGGVATNRNGLENVLADLGMDTDFTAQVLGMNKQSYTQLVEDAVASGRTAIESTVNSIYQTIQGISPTSENLAFWTNRLSWGLETYDNLIRSVQQEQQNIDALRIVGNATNLSDSGAGGWSSWGGPSFAVGTNFVPDDMLAQVHRGERIIPAADNAQLMQSLNNRDEANRVLVSEIRNLRSEVKQLREQQAKETGNIIVANFDAQQRAAEKIETAMNNTAQQSTWTAKVREGVKLK